MKLYYSKNLNPRLAVAAARYLNSPVEFVAADPQNPANKEKFRPLNPNCPGSGSRGKWQNPVGGGCDCASLVSIGEVGFLARGMMPQPDMIRWVSWATHHLNRAADPLYFFRVVWPTFSTETPPQQEMEQGLADFRRHGAVLDEYLQAKDLAR